MTGDQPLDTCCHYLAAAPPSLDSGTAVVVLHEWWGLTGLMMEACRRLASHGFSAIAPDLYGGEVAPYGQPERAAALHAATRPDAVIAAVKQAAALLTQDRPLAARRVAVLGFCSGGRWTFHAAAALGTRIAAAIAYYGVPAPGDPVDWQAITCPVLGHFAECDEFCAVADVTRTAAELDTRDKDYTFHVYRGAGHAFANADNPIGTYNHEISELAWQRSIAMLGSISSPPGDPGSRPARKEN